MYTSASKTHAPAGHDLQGAGRSSTKKFAGGFSQRIDRAQISILAFVGLTNGAPDGQMNQLPKSTMRPPVRHYDASYGNFQSDLYAEIRREAFGDDIGQNSWLTAAELDTFVAWLDLAPGKT